MIKTPKQIILVLIIFLLGIIPMILIYDSIRDKDNTSYADISEKQKSSLRTGDIIFTEGVSFKSDIVRVASSNKDCQYSHCGIVCIENDNVYIVHMSIDADKIVKEKISDFLIKNRVRSFSTYRVGVPMETNLMINALNNLLQECVKFDNKYDASEVNELYCTEMICFVYDKISNISLYPYNNRTRKIFPDKLLENIILLKII